MENRCTINVSFLYYAVVGGVGMVVLTDLFAEVRMLKDFDLDNIKVRQVKFMKDVPPKYEID